MVMEKWVLKKFMYDSFFKKNSPKYFYSKQIFNFLMIQFSAHNLLAVKNHLRFVTGYRDNATDIMKLIENQLNISN